MSLKPAILRLLSEGKSPREISETLGCSYSYISVAKMRKDGLSESDRKYLNSDGVREYIRAYRRNRFQTDAVYREKCREYWRVKASQKPRI